MRQCVDHCRRLTAVGFAATMLSLPLVFGCAGGPSQEELSNIEEQRKVVAAAENKVADLKADKAQLERKLAEKKAVLKQAKENQKEASAKLGGGS